MYHIETNHLICKASEFLLKGNSEQTTNFCLQNQKYWIFFCCPSPKNPIMELRFPLSFFALSQGPWRIIAQFCGLRTNQKWKNYLKGIFWLLTFFDNLEVNNHAKAFHKNGPFFVLLSLFLFFFLFFFFFSVLYKPTKL